MTSATGWYGPLIDLRNAASHIGDFVQLLVFVHRSIPAQYRLPKGGEVIRTDIQVGDDTLPFFSVSLWQKKMGEKVVAGDIILLQNVKITQFGHVVEAKTVQCSSLICLVHPYESLLSKGVNELMVESRAGKTKTEKLRMVIKWVQRAKPALHTIGSCSLGKQPRNWKVPKQSEYQNFLLLSELVILNNSCKAIFNASVGEIFLPITWKALGDFEKEKMFASKRIIDAEDDTLIEDFICIGCQLCGFPLDAECRPIYEQNAGSLYCPKSTNHLHAVTLIYRPFMLYVWDESNYLPLLVRNEAAVLLFGNIRAERVYSCYRGQSYSSSSNQAYFCKENKSETAGKGLMGSGLSDADTSPDIKENGQSDKNMKFHLIWLILLKMLLQQGKNSPLKFEVNVDPALDTENGKFEMLSVSIPCAKKQIVG